MGVGSGGGGEDGGGSVGGRSNEETGGRRGWGKGVRDGAREHERGEGGRAVREWEAGVGTGDCGPLDVIWTVDGPLAHPTDAKGCHLAHTRGWVGVGRTDDHQLLFLSSIDSST